MQCRRMNTSAFCIPDKSQTGRQRIRADSPRSFPTSTCTAPEGGYWRGACVVFDGGSFPRWLCGGGQEIASGTSYAKEDLEKVMVNTLPSKHESHNMHLLFTPILASGLWIGGGSVGLLLIIIVVVLLLRGR